MTHGELDGQTWLKKKKQEPLYGIEVKWDFGPAQTLRTTPLLPPLIQPDPTFKFEEPPSFWLLIKETVFVVLAAVAGASLAWWFR